MSAATSLPLAALRSGAPESIELTSINTIRTLCMDAVQAANSGHPGTPMAMAPVAYCLWQQFLRYDPQDPSAESRSFCSLGRPRLHSALLVIASDGSACRQQGL
jgi:transketolase N-terminal domain/subunit